MKKNNLHVGLMAFAILLGVSCSDDNGLPSYSTNAVQNTELRNILTQKGYQFSEEGKLLLNDLANNTITLDLSGTQISTDALSELSMFPNLTDVDLSDNGYSLSFDFSSLPAQITGVDLTGNELYEFPGLVNVKTFDNGDEHVSVLHSLNKLYLPESAKYNCDEIVAFYQKTPGVDMQMQDATGKLAKYNTLREIPDKSFRSLLKKEFSSLFDGDYIDISKRLVDVREAGQAITTINMDERTWTVDDVDGFQYIAGNKGYRGTYINLTANKNCEVRYFPIGATISDIGLKYISTPNGIDLSKATTLKYLSVEYNPTIPSLDLSASTSFGQRGDNMEKTGNAVSYMLIGSCEKLQSITFPQKAVVFRSLNVVNCPALEELDLSQFEAAGSFGLGGLPSCKVTYLAPKRKLNGSYLFLGVDEEMYKRTESRTFIRTYRDMLRSSGCASGHGVKSYSWMKDFNSL